MAKLTANRLEKYYSSEYRELESLIRNSLNVLK